MSRQRRGRPAAKKRVVVSPPEQPGRPPSSKQVTLVLSVGPENTSSVEEFLDEVRALLLHAYPSSLVSKVSTTYGHDGEQYYDWEWEEWDGTASTKPLPAFKPREQKLVTPRRVERGELTTADVAAGLREVRRDLTRKRSVVPVPSRRVGERTGTPPALRLSDLGHLDVL